MVYVPPGSYVDHSLLKGDLSYGFIYGVDFISLYPAELVYVRS